MKSQHTKQGRVSVVLVGGTYGSGKSTIAASIQEKVQSILKTAIVDYDTLIGNGIGRVVDVAQAEAARKAAWDYGLLNAVQARIHQGYELIVVPGTFSTRERRDRFVTNLEDMADVLPFYYMLPMRETIARIQRGRTGETHLVNATRWRDFYRAHNRAFAAGDHTDLLLPANRDRLAPEYKALLSRLPCNRHVLATPHLDVERLQHRWIVLTEALPLPLLMSLLQEGIMHPLHIRSRIEGELLSFSPSTIERPLSVPLVR